METEKDNLDEESKELWENYELTEDQTAEATKESQLTQEKFWQEYDQLKQNAQLQQSSKIQQADHLPAIPRNFPSLLSIPPEKVTAFDKATLNYNWKLYRPFASLAIIAPVVLAATGFTNDLGTLITVVGSFTLFAVPYAKNTNLLRRLSRSIIEIKSQEIVRYGKGVPKRTVKLSEVAALETDDLGLVIKVHNLGENGKTTLKDAFTIPFVIENYEALKAFLEKLVARNQKRHLER